MIAATNRPYGAVAVLAVVTQGVTEHVNARFFGSTFLFFFICYPFCMSPFALSAQFPKMWAGRVLGHAACAMHAYLPIGFVRSRLEYIFELGSSKKIEKQPPIFRPMGNVVLVLFTQVGRCGGATGEKPPDPLVSLRRWYSPVLLMHHQICKKHAGSGCYALSEYL